MLRVDLSDGALHVRSGQTGFAMPTALDAIKEALAELGEQYPKVRSAKPEDFADMSLIKEFDDNGFIDGLYKKR